MSSVLQDRLSELMRPVMTRVFTVIMDDLLYAEAGAAMSLLSITVKFTLIFRILEFQKATDTKTLPEVN